MPIGFDELNRMTEEAAERIRQAEINEHLTQVQNAKNWLVASQTVNWIDGELREAAVKGRRTFVIVIAQEAFPPHASLVFAALKELYPELTINGTGSNHRFEFCWFNPKK